MMMPPNGTQALCTFTHPAHRHMHAYAPPPPTRSVPLVASCSSLLHPPSLLPSPPISPHPHIALCSHSCTLSLHPSPPLARPPTRSPLERPTGTQLARLQIILVLAAALGSFLAFKSSPEDALYNIGEDVSLVRVALGGALVLFGARLADGCTSGHGITGMGHLTLRSLIAVRVWPWCVCQSVCQSVCAGVSVFTLCV